MFGACSVLMSLFQATRCDQNRGDWRPSRPQGSHLVSSHDLGFHEHVVRVQPVRAQVGRAGWKNSKGRNHNLW